MTFNRIETIKESLRSKIQHAEDVVFKELHTKDKYIETFYIKSISDENILQNN
jgi:spore germination protein